MKKLVFILLAVVITLASCDDNSDGLPFGSSGIFDLNGNPIPDGLKLLFTAELIRETEGDYIVTPRIFDVDVKINGRDYGNFQSFPLDTAFINYSASNESDQFLSTPVKVQYGFFASGSQRPDTLNTISDYKKFMNDDFDLSPGSHFLEVNGLSILDKDGNEVSIRTRLFRLIEIPENETNVFIGNLEFKI